MADTGPYRGPDRDPDFEATGFRFGWGGIFGGFVIAVVLQIMLGVLGLAIGFSSWEPGTGLGGLDTGSWVWTILSALVSLFVGGVVVGRLAGVLTTLDGALHGLIMWGVSVMVGIWLVFAGAGFLLGTAFDTVGRVAGAAVSGVTQVGASAIGQADLGEIDFQALEGEVEQILQQTREPALQPESLQAAAQGAADTALTDQPNREAARDVVEMIERRAGAVDREAIVNVMVARTGMSRAEAQRAADRVETAVQNAQSQISTTVDTLQADVTSAARDVTDALGTAMWWLFVWLILSGGAAAAGAAITAKS